jgi:hypothetical protein
MKTVSRSSRRAPARKTQPQNAASPEPLAAAATAHKFRQAEQFALDYNGLDADERALIHEAAHRLRAANLRPPKTRSAEKASVSSGMSFQFYELLVRCSDREKHLLADLVWIWRRPKADAEPPAGYYPAEHERAGREQRRELEAKYPDAFATSRKKGRP